MTTNTKTSDVNSQKIKDQEAELKELLNRVMSDPLQALKRQITQLDNRLQSIETFSKTTADERLPAVQAAIRAQGEYAQNSFRNLRKNLNEEFPELLNEYLSSVSQKIGSLEEVVVLASEKTVAKIDESRKDFEKNLDRMQSEEHQKLQQLGKEITAFAGNVSSLPEGVGHLLTGQILVKDLVGDVRKEQALQAQQVNDNLRQSEMLLLKSFNQMGEINNLAEMAVKTSEKAIDQINSSREDIRQNLHGIQADGRLEIKQLGNGIKTLADSLVRTGAQVTEFTPRLVSRTDELGLQFESGFASLRKQSEKDRNELSSALQVMQKRFLWLSVLCGLSFAGSAGLVVSRFVLHV